MDLEFLIKKAINSGKIKKVDMKMEDEDEDEDDYHIFHRGIEIKKKDIYMLMIDPVEASFLYVSIPSDKKIYFYAANDISSNLIEDIGYHTTGNTIKGINFEDRKFCIELTLNEYNQIYINFITTLPDGCENKFCNKLNGLFALLFKFLNQIGYKDAVSLKDDARVGGDSLVFLRLMKNDKNIIIYEKYGFKMSVNRYNDIIKAKKDNDIIKLKNFTSNIPMRAKNINEFDKC